MFATWRRALCQSLHFHQDLFVACLRLVRTRDHVSLPPRQARCGPKKLASDPVSRLISTGFKKKFFREEKIH